MSDVKNEPTPQEAKEVKQHQENEAGSVARTQEYGESLTEKDLQVSDDRDEKVAKE